MSDLFSSNDGTSERRSFNRVERDALFQAFGGRCARCTEPLGDDWEPDHYQPHSAGGSTDVLNGQPLCRRCNRKKGSRWTPQLREWQRNALDSIRGHGALDYLCVATPGAGKTTLANAVALEFVRVQRASRLVVVCPSDHLKKQWAQAAARVGLELDYTWTGGNLSSEFRGVVVTFQAVASNPHLVRLLTRQATLGIIDEIHHAGRDKSWGENLQYALQHAVFRLALSGTPFRSDNHAIPFVRYESNVSIADFQYGYGQALDDDVVRPVFFPRWDGRMEWMQGADVMTATFADELDEQASKERLRTAITSETWLRDVLNAAGRQLGEIRAEGHHTAGGLVIAMDISHAQQIARLLKRETGRAPVLATSDDPEASAKISRFRESSDEWLVAVKMVSEGVDIPRLRVCVFATNIGSRLFFRQAVGRLVRVLPDLDEQNAYFYIPDDPLLKKHALEIKTEREHHLRAEIDRALESRSAPEADGELSEPSQPKLYSPISAEASEAGAVFNSELIDLHELDHARAVAYKAGLRPKTNESLYPIAAVLKAAGMVERTATATLDRPKDIASEGPSVVPLAARKKELRKLNAKSVGRLSLATGVDHKTLNWQLNSAVGIKSIDQASEQQLLKRLEVLRRRIEEGK